MPNHLNIEHVTDRRLEHLLEGSSIDSVIADSEDGFCQLGQAREFLSKELGYPDTSLGRWMEGGHPDLLEPSIGQLADWCRARSPEITLAVIPSRRIDTQLKGLILSPYDGSQCYLQFANGEWSRPHRDFMYSVTWESLYQAVHRLDAKHPALMHLSRVRTWKSQYQWEVTYCQVEAALNFHDQFQGFSNLTFWDPYPGNCVTEAIEYFQKGNNRSPHRPFTHFSTEQWGINFVTIDWLKGKNLSFNNRAVKKNMF